MIELHLDEEVLAQNVAVARAKGIVLPTLAEQADPALVPAIIREGLPNVGLWEIDPLNLFRITWHNQPLEQGGLFAGVNSFEIPSALTGVKSRIIGLVGKWFPTGCHKVGASYGCLVPRLITGQFSARYHRAVWPSTGNYCRGGAFNSRLLSCKSVAILPEGMSRERFDWLRTVADETIATPGTESNVKEIFDAVREIRLADPDAFVFNQFEEFGNYLWHYAVTGPAMLEVVEQSGGRLAGLCLTSGSAGTLAAGDRLKEVYPGMQIVAGEALQCSTMLNNGYGEHRIEGIGDKHIPWIHNVRNTDMVIAIDDRDVLALFRLFNDPQGLAFLEAESGLDAADLARLSLLGLSGIANLLMAIKFATLHDLTDDDIVLTVFTDSAAMYISRLEEMQAIDGDYTFAKAAEDFKRLNQLSPEAILLLNDRERRRIHNLKYYTWVEQQGKTVAELEALWSEEGTFRTAQGLQGEVDALIRSFNAKVLAC